MTKPTGKSDFKVDFHRLRTVFKKGTVIFRENESRDNAYIIESGKVEISTIRDGKKIPLVLLGHGEVFGETALLGEGPRTASAVAVEDTEVFTISPDLLRDRVMHLDPLVGLLMSLLVSRYRQWRYKSPDDISSDKEGGDGEAGGQSEHAGDRFMQDLHRQKTTALNELRMAQEISKAIEAGQFGPYLQPIVSLPDQQLFGFEALIRWHHPERGMISPLEFIPVAERTHVVQDLDMMMLKRVCEIAPKMQEAAGKIGRTLYISVNLSGGHFDSENIVSEIKGILDKSSVDPAQIVFEITESALMGDPAVAEKVLHDIKALGVRIALDDFGTGYSSLGYLHRFSIDILKVDRSFVQDIQNNRKSLDIVRAIVSLAKTFDLKIVGEGVENENEIFSLSGIGCDFGQGYLFSKPVPVDKALEFVRSSVLAHG